jgi:hypothetical protein
MFPPSLEASVDKLDPPYFNSYFSVFTLYLLLFTFYFFSTAGFGGSGCFS